MTKGKILYKLEDYDGAFLEFDKADWHFRSENPIALRWRGIARYQLGQRKNAIEDFQRENGDLQKRKTDSRGSIREFPRHLLCYNRRHIGFCCAAFNVPGKVILEIFQRLSSVKLTYSTKFALIK
mgnify:CR=1 FL=1